MKKIILTTCLPGFIGVNSWAQTNKTFFLGHSLINFHVPNMVDQLSIEGSQTFSYDANIGNGASLAWHTTSPTSGQGDQWDLTLPDGGYENFILTEAVPLMNSINFSNTYRYADTLCSFANLYNPGIQHYIYETWHCINSGNGSTSGEGGYPCSWDEESTAPWRERLTDDLPKWETIADSINLIHANPMLVIPGGQAMARLSDSIDVGAVPGLASIEDFFVDEHHLDNRGNYFIGCVMYSVIHGISPEGLPNQLMNPYGTLYIVYPTPDQAEKLQQIAWETVCDYQRDGVSCETTYINEIEKETQLIHAYPIPARETLSIQYDAFSSQETYTICDRLGNTVQKGILTSKTTTVALDNLSSGMYFLSVNDQTIKIIK